MLSINLFINYSFIAASPTLTAFSNAAFASKLGSAAPVITFFSSSLIVTEPVTAGIVTESLICSPTALRAIFSATDAL